MASNTTTAQLIRERQRNVIEGLTPNQLGRDTFKEYRRGNFRDWAVANPEAAFRRFHIEDLNDYDIPDSSDLLTESQRTTFLVEVAYPEDNRYGEDDVDGLADAIANDRNLIDHAIGIFGQSSYVNGQNAAITEATSVEKDDDVWFLTFEITIHFRRTVDINPGQARAGIHCTATVGVVSTAGVSMFLDGCASVAANATVTGAATLGFSSIATPSATASMAAATVLGHAGASSPSATATMAAVSVLVNGPTELLDLDFRTPLTSWKSGFTGFSHANATEEWLLQADTLGSYPNTGSSGTATLDIDGGGSLPGQTAQVVHNGTDYGTRLAWEAVDGADLLESSAAAGNCDGEDMAGCIVWQQHGLGVNNDILLWHGGNAASDEGWRLTTGSSDRIAMDISDGTNGVTLETTGDGFSDGGLNYVKWWYDESADVLYIKSSRDSGTSVSTAAVTGSLSSSDNLFVNGRFKTVDLGIQGLQVSYVGIAIGSTSEDFYNEDFWQHAGDPNTTTGLTDVKRDSLISVPLSASTVGHFSGATTAALGCQLPLGFNPLMAAGAGGIALKTNSAVTNLVPYSRASTGAGGSTTNTDNDSDAPDGFRAATRSTATSANDYIGKTCVTVASTEYTGSVYLKESTVGVTGRLIMYDETNTAELGATAFTADGTWAQRIKITASTIGGGISTSLRLEIDTDTESVLHDFWQLETGDSPTSIVNTSGSAAALVFCDYNIAGSAGDFADGSQQGEMEVVWITDKVDSTTSPYVCAHGAGATLNNGILVLNSSGTNLQFWKFNSAAGTAANKTIASIGQSAQENTSVLQWDPAGLLSAESGAELYIDHNSGTATTFEVGTFTGTNTLDNLQIGNAAHSTTTNTALDGFIARIRTWDGER